MKLFKFKITEYSLVGVTFREVEVKARTEMAAVNKITQLRGNREWSWGLLSVKGI